MFEKNLQIGYLLDFYGDILPERKRSVMDMYYNEDLSLAEIAAEIGISRPGVRDMIKKSEAELKFYEEKLGLAQKLKRAEESANRVSESSSALELPSDFLMELNTLIKIITE